MKKYRKFMYAALWVGAIVFMGCASTMSKVEMNYAEEGVHKEYLSKREIPKMAYPAIMQPEIDRIKSTTDFKLIGSVVSNDGSFVLLFSDGKIETGVVFSSGGQFVQYITIEQFWEMYELICIKNKKCTDNPHKTDV